MAARKYKNAPSHTIPSGVANSSTTSIVVDSVTGWPTQFPFTVIIEPDTALEEICDVTNVVGTTLTVTRGADGSTASAHAAGSVIAHGYTARDATEANDHINATTGIHGATGSLVDTGSNQTISGNKTLSGTTTANGALNTNGANAHAGNNTFNSGVFLGSSGSLNSTDGSVDTLLNGTGTGRLREVAIGRHVVKSADQGVTVTTMTNATDLVIPVVANGVYEVEVELMFESTSSTANLKIGWSLPSGGFNMTGIGPGTGVTAASNVAGNFVGAINAVSGVLVFGSPAAGTPTFCVRLKARLAIGGTGGNAQLQFAENTASATVTMKTGSWLTSIRRA